MGSRIQALIKVYPAVEATAALLRAAQLFAPITNIYRQK